MTIATFLTTPKGPDGVSHLTPEQGRRPTPVRRMSGGVRGWGLGVAKKMRSVMRPPTPPSATPGQGVAVGGPPVLL